MASKKTVAPATPAAVVQAAPKVAPKLAAVPSAPAGTTPSRAARRAAPKGKAPAAPVPPPVEKKLIPVKKTATASLAGSLASISQARHVLHNSRSFGEALDTLGRLESQAREQLGKAVHEELAKAKVKTEGHNIGTESKPDGVHIVLTKQVEAPQ
jgi:hypothetical protein